MDIHLHIDRVNEHLALSLAGELDLATARTLTEAIHAFRATEFARVTLDLARLRFCDCSGLNAFITAHNTITDAGGEFQITRPPPGVRMLLTVARCDWLMHPAQALATTTV
jgi:anti-anti-sigma factor